MNRRIALIRDTELPVKTLHVSLTDDAHTFVYLDDGSFAYVQESAVEPGLYQGSGHRALAAVLSTLKSEMSFLQGQAPVKVYWQTDSRNCFLFLPKGSCQPVIQADIVAIKSIEKSCNITVIPVWTPREHGRLVLVDMGLRFLSSTDKWCISRPQLRDIFRNLYFEPTIDCCASKANAICSIYFLGLPQTSSAGVNFLAQQMQQGQFYFYYPPVSLIVPCFKKLLSIPNV